MIRILQIVNIMDRAGLETMLMNYYRKIDRSKVQFDFLVHRNKEGAYDKEIESLGGKIYRAPRLYPQNYISYFCFMKRFFCEHNEYKIVHCHIDSMSFFPIIAALFSKIPIRIAHSHSTKIDFDYKYPIKFICKLFLPYIANYFFACSYEASKFLFPRKNSVLVKNAINVDLLYFNAKKREQLRDFLNLNEKFVIGHVGRFNYVKNQLFLLDVIAELKQIQKNIVLLLIGKGEDEIKIRDKAKSLGIDENVRILLDRSDVNDLYNVMDVFVMPSLFEGLPLVGVEAQTNGLPCLFSDTISKEILLSSNSSFFSLKHSAKDWALKISELNKCRNQNSVNEVNNKGFNIEHESKKLQQWYESAYNKTIGNVYENSNDRP